MSESSTSPTSFTISIPKGSIKRSASKPRPRVWRPISIPKGSIKSANGAETVSLEAVFQFQKVRLKVLALEVAIVDDADFNSKRFD